MTTVAFNTAQKPEMPFTQIKHVRDEDKKTNSFALTFFAGVASLLLLPPPINVMLGLVLIVLSLPLGAKLNISSNRRPIGEDRDIFEGQTWGGWGSSWPDMPFFGGHSQTDTGGFSDGWFTAGHQQPGSTQAYPPQGQRQREVDTDVIGERDPVGSSWLGGWR